MDKNIEIPKPIPEKLPNHNDDGDFGGNKQYIPSIPEKKTDDETKKFVFPDIPKAVPDEYEKKSGNDDYEPGR